MAEIDWVFDIVPRESWLAGKTSGRESGIGFRFGGRDGEYRLFHADTEHFRGALGLADQRCCDYALFWQRAGGMHSTAIELKGGSLDRAFTQIESLLDAIARRARGRTLKPSAVIVFRGRLDKPLLQRLIGRLRRVGVEVHVKTAKKGNVDIDPLLVKLDGG